MKFNTQASSLWYDCSIS